MTDGGFGAGGWDGGDGMSPGPSPGPSPGASAESSSSGPMPGAVQQSPAGPAPGAATESTDWSPAGGGADGSDGTGPAITSFDSSSDAGSPDAGSAVAVADGAEAVATSAAGVASAVEAYVDRTLAEFRRMYSEYRYGSFCGPGGGGEPIDDIDTCCESHDHAYAAVGQTGHDLGAMFSAAGVLATEAADRTLVSCLNATISGPTWHDPAAIVYREAAMAIFAARVAAAEYVRSHGGG